MSKTMKRERLKNPDKKDATIIFQKYSVLLHRPLIEKKLSRKRNTFFAKFLLLAAGKFWLGIAGDAGALGTIAGGV